MDTKEELNQNLLQQIRKEVNEKLSSYDVHNNSKRIISQGVSAQGNYFSLDNTQSSVVIDFFKNNIITIKDLIFYQRTKEENDDYFFILKKLQNIEFINCTFETKGLVFGSRKILFNKCKFPNQHTVNCCNLLDNKNTLYLNCTFNQTVFINVEEKEINIPLFRDCTFTDSIQARNKTFNKPLFLNTQNMKSRRINQILLTDCIFKNNFIIDSSDRKSDKSLFHINKLDLTNSIFKAEDGHKTKVKIQFCEIENAIFYNTSFYDLADFYQTKFHKVNFERADFFSIAVFSETEFMCDTNFNYVKFFGKAIFRDTVITGILNLRNTIFDDEANFLDISGHNRKNDKGEFIGEPSDIKVANRETARIIKNFYDSTNNIIEANKFYALEMKEREKELDDDIKKRKNIFEWLVFKIHGMASNHSQDFLLALFWILNITFVTVFLQFELVCENSFVKLFDRFFFFFGGLILLGYGISKLKENFRNIAIILFSIISYFIYSNTYIDDSSLKLFSNTLNPFSIMTGNEELTFSGLIYKIVIAYLIYQLIISIRQNTRRK